jgi:ADP-ribose pyrophosphatase
VDGATHVVLVRQTRIATGETLLEIPAGTREPDEDAATTARRELPEEIGYTCGRLERIGGFFTAPGYSSEFMDIFVASELSPETAEGDEDEDIEIITMPLGEAARCARSGELRDGKTVAALLMVAAQCDA